jgi:hypothetical protein
VIGMNVLALNQLHQPLAPVGPPAAAVLKSAPRRLADAVRIEMFVYTDRTGLDPLGDTAALGMIACPDARRQAKFGIICQANRFVLGRKCRDRQCRPERLLTHCPHIVMDIGDDGRLVEKSLKIGVTTAAGLNLRPC